MAYLASQKEPAQMLQKRQGVAMSGKKNSCFDNQDGSTFVEYLVIMGFVGLSVAAAMAALGVPLLRYFHLTQFVLSAPVP